MAATLSAIHVFPVKSCAALAPQEAVVESRGLAGDRRWMVADADGKFLTARKHPRLVLVRALPDGNALQLDAPDMPTLRLCASGAASRVETTVWRSTVQAVAADEEADRWISTFLGMPARFVHMDAQAMRAVDPDYGRPGDEVSFADGFPLLLICAATLDELNSRLVEMVPMLRFRPNLVVANTSPNAEDTWKRIRVGRVEFDVVKPCVRCTIPTVDLKRGDFDPTGEPLRTLTTYRRTPIGVTFGQNLIPRGGGVVRVGDRVAVLR